MTSQGEVEAVWTPGEFTATRSQGPPQGSPSNLCIAVLGSKVTVDTWEGFQHLSRMPTETSWQDIMTRPTEIQSCASTRGGQFLPLVNKNYTAQKYAAIPERSSNPEMKIHVVLGRWEETGPRELSLKSAPVTWLLLQPLTKAQNNKTEQNKVEISSRRGNIHPETQEARFMEGLSVPSLKAESHLSPQQEPAILS